MGKNKKGGLIEDRVIRNPMDQMRRKLKFKDKEKRKEVRQIHRELREEFGMGPSKKDVRYLMEHDPNFVAGQGQLAEALQGPNSMAANEAEVDQGPSNQDISMKIWDAMEQNYDRVQRGETASFNYNPFKEEEQEKPQTSKHHFKAQPYQRKQLQTSNEVIASKPVLYQKPEAKPQAAPKPAPPKEPPQQAKKMQDKRQQKRGPDLDDPFDPTNATKNYKSRGKDELEDDDEPQVQPQTQPTPQIYATKPTQKQPTSSLDQQAKPQRFLPAALRRKLAQSQPQDPAQQSQSVPSGDIHSTNPASSQPKTSEQPALKAPAEQPTIPMSSVPRPAMSFSLIKPDDSDDDDTAQNAKQAIAQAQPLSLLAHYADASSSESDNEDDDGDNQPVLKKPEEAKSALAVNAPSVGAPAVGAPTVGVPVSTLKVDRSKVWGRKRN